MPRYALDDAGMKSLIAYLRRLAAEPAAGAAGGTLEFASVVAPGTDPARGRAMVEVLQACVDEHNAGPAPERGRKRLAESVSARQPQPWRLHVWALEGKPDTWGRQLAEHARRQPVFALVGGLGGGQWAPVHEFCEAGALPCVFPHLEAAAIDEAGFYGLYLSPGTILEAGIVAQHLADEGGAVKRVVQVLRPGDDAARAGADALRRALAGRGVELSERQFDLQGAAFDVEPSDALILWLRTEDLQRLDAFQPSIPAPRGCTFRQRLPIHKARCCPRRCARAHSSPTPTSCRMPGRFTRSGCARGSAHAGCPRRKSAPERTRCSPARRSSGA
jgi:hypothetical protein